MVVMHYTAMKSAEAALQRLCDPAYEVSAHYLVAEDGRLWQMVREADRAWHAGKGAWGAVTDVNSHSIGIELANTGRHPFPEPQMLQLEALLTGILDRWHIPARRIIGHQDMAPDRKIDPGRRFDWQRLGRQSLAAWPDFDPMPEAERTVFSGPQNAWLEPLHAVGYPSDASPEQVLDAFRARFRSFATGPCRQADHLTALRVASDFPVDARFGIA